MKSFSKDIGAIAENTGLSIEELQGLKQEHALSSIHNTKPSTIE